MKPKQIITYSCPGCGAMFPTEANAQHHIDLALHREDAKHVAAAKEATP